MPRNEPPRSSFALPRGLLATACFTLATLIGATVHAQSADAVEPTPPDHDDLAPPTDAGAVESAVPDDVGEPSPSAVDASAIEPEAEAPPAGLPGYIDANGYYDTRGFTTVTINSFAVLPRGFSYFAFVDYTNDFDAPELADSSSFYTEQNVQWGRWMSSPLELHLQWGLGAAVGYDIPDVARVGARIHARPTHAVGRFFDRIHLFATLTYFPYVQYLAFERPNAWESQISFFYRLEPFADRIDHRIYLQGWGDFDFRTGKGLLDVITEHQIGIRLAGEFYAIAEFRHASFMAKTTGVGFGLEYRMRFEIPTRAR